MRRLTKTRKPLNCWKTICQRPAIPHAHDLRDRGMTFAWYPVVESAKSCFLWTGKLLMNQHRVAQRLWADMTQKEIRDELKQTLVTSHGNSNV